MSKPIQVSNATFENDVLHSEMPVLVDFYADWCGPCKVISPMLEEIAEELDGQLRVAKINVDDNVVESTRHNVQSIPTLILFKGGRPVERWAGVVPKELILSRIHEHVSEVEVVEN